VKCPGAGHKACWLSEDYLRKHGRRPDVKVTYVTPSAKVLGLQRYLPTIERITQVCSRQTQQLWAAVLCSHDTSINCQRATA
jgi:hypothetical protein